MTSISERRAPYDRRPNRRAVIGAVLAAGAIGLPAPSRAAIPSPRDRRVAALAQRIAGLLRDREANDRAIAAAEFDLPETPAALTTIYRGPFGPVRVEVDGDWLRAMQPDYSPLSRRGRRLHRLLRIHEQHYARLNADREASGLGALISERERIDRELEAAAEEARSLEGHSAPHIALTAAAALAARSWPNDAPTILLALLKAAGAA